MQRQTSTWLWAALGLGAWCSAGALLAFREHFVYQYVVGRDVPMDDGRLAGALLTLAAIGLAVAAGAINVTRRGDEAKSTGRQAFAWMISCAVIPALEKLRSLGVAVPTTFLEPLYFGFATTMSFWALRAGSLGRGFLPANGGTEHLPTPSSTKGRSAAWNGPAFWRPCLVALVTLAAAWWFYQGEQSYRDYRLGYPDFAEYAHRVANTWAGRGFLARPPNWPTFYDHFNPGLALLAPLWGIWPDARLMILIQALCLAAPAVFVAGLAKRFGAGPAGAVAWAAAYLVLPAVGQLNLNYSYGFHPVSLALVTVTGGLWAAFSRRPWLALALAMLSCSFEESVFVALAGISLAIAAVEFQYRNKARAAASQEPCGDVAAGTDRSKQPQADALSRLSSPTGVPVWVWLSAALCFALGFILVVNIAHLTEGTLRWRLGNLGENLTAAALSPVLRPKIFWGQIFRPESLYFVLSLFVPAGGLFVLRGWRALLGLAAPLLVLLTWSVDGSTCIALQYVTLLIPCIVLAALLGASAIADREAQKTSNGRSNLMAWAGVAALAGGTVTSIFFGALPVSRPTIPFTLTASDRAELEPRRTILDRAVQLVSAPHVAVLASCRLAAHLLNVHRLEDVNFALRKRDALTKEAQREEGQRWIEIFDWVAVDLRDRNWNHSLGDLKTVVFEAEAAGYQAVLAARGVLVYHRPRPNLPLQDALRPWRVSRAEAERLARSLPASPQQTPGLRVLRLAVAPAPGLGKTDSSPAKADVEVVLQATKNGPPEYCFQYVLDDVKGVAVAQTDIRLTANENRPSSWWRKGEAWRDRMTIDLPAGKTLAELHGRLVILPVEAFLQSVQTPLLACPAAPVPE